MDAWIDCMTCLDSPEAGMSTVHAPPNGVLVLELDHVDDFFQRCPDQFFTLLECIAFVNWRRLEVGHPAVLVLSYFAHKHGLEVRHRDDPSGAPDLKIGFFAIWIKPQHDPENVGGNRLDGMARYQDGSVRIDLDVTLYVSEIETFLQELQARRPEIRFSFLIESGFELKLHFDDSRFAHGSLKISPHPEEQHFATALTLDQSNMAALCKQLETLLQKHPRNQHT